MYINSAILYAAQQCLNTVMRNDPVVNSVQKPVITPITSCIR